MKKHFLLLAFLLFSTVGFCQLRLPRLISDGMVLQRDTEVRIWGWASAGEQVKLIFNSNTFTEKAGKSGDWEIMLPAQDAGGPYEMILEASNTIKVQNILFGDVWVCSGQSNMELTMERVKEKYADVIKNADNPNIRHFLVPDEYDFKKEHENLSSGSWQSANPGSVLDFSAVAYFFAKELYNTYNVPIGLINAALGGSPVEAWMSEEALKEFPTAYNELQKFKEDSLIARIEKQDRQRSDQWYKELNEKDQGLTNLADWRQQHIDDSDWSQMEIPGYWADESAGDINGVVWFRKNINVPERMTGRTAKLWLGRIVDQDYVYVNGQLVGTTSYQYPPRRYTIDPGVLKEGENTIAIRVINQSGKGGFVPDKPYYLAVGNDTIDLKGKWKYKTGATMAPLKSQTFIRWKPAGLYNSMIAPLHNYKIKGVIWYQGESNTSNPRSYETAFPSMIREWRKRWEQEDFPFLFVQLTNFMETNPEPTESNWAELRQVQLNALSVKNAGMAVTIDLGEWNDIHPLNKKDVGKRLALEAKKVAYNESGIASSPVPSGADFKKDHVTIKFKNTGEGLTTRNGKKPAHFAISADGKSFSWAKAEIEGNKIKVWHEKVLNPVAVRYAWADNPDSANLYNKEGLPASPFEVRK